MFLFDNLILTFFPMLQCITWHKFDFHARPYWLLQAMNFDARKTNKNNIESRYVILWK